MVPLYSRSSLLLRTLLLVGALALGIHATASAQSWSRLARPATSPIPDLYGVHFFNQLKGFVCGTRGSAAVLYITENGGVTWTQVATPGSTDAFNDVVFPGNGSLGVLVGNGGYVAVTTDSGATWSARNVTTATWAASGDIYGAYVTSVGTLNSIVVVGKAAGGGSGPRIAVTSNGGANWTNVTLTGSANNLYDIDFFNSQRGMVIGTGNAPRRSLTTDGGATWEAAATMLLQPYQPPTSLSFYGVSAVWGTPIGYASGGYIVPPTSNWYSEVRRTRDYGATWDSTGFTRAHTDPASDVLAVDTNLVYVTTRNFGVYRSMDGGRTWLAETMPTGSPTGDLRKLSRISTGEVFCVGYSGIVLRGPAPPNINVSTDSLAFPKSCPGVPSTRTISVSNDGGMPLVIDSIRLVQPTQPQVTYTILYQPTTIPAGGIDSIVIMSNVSTVAPPGLYIGEITIYNNDELYAGADKAKRVKLSTPITTRTLQIDTVQSRDAGTVRISPFISSSVVLGSFFTVTGECAVSVTSVRLLYGTDFRVLDPTTSFQLTSGQSRSVLIEFQPTRPCLRIDTLIIEHNAINYPSPLKLAVRGIGVEPSVQTSPRDTLDFGGVLVAQTKVDTLALLNQKTNTCLDTTRLDTMRIVGPNAADFTAGLSITGTTALAPSARLPIAMTARPSAQGQRIAYAVIQHEIGGQSPDTVVLVVNGLQSALTTLNTAVNFAATDVGGQRDSIVVNFVQNLGSAPASITGTQMLGTHPGDFAYVSPTPPISLSPTPQSGYRQTITLRFQPTAVGARSALLRLLTSSGNIDITLQGNAEEAVGTTRVGDVNFPPTDVNNCTDSTISKLIINRGTVPLRLDSLAIVNEVAGSGDSLAFQIVSPIAPPQQVIQPGDSLSVRIRFCPTRSGPYEVRLIAYNNSAEDPFVVKMTGTGRARVLVQYDSVVFAATRVLNVRDSTILGVLSNRGSSTIQIDSAVISGADVNSFTLRSSLPFPLPAGRDTSLTVRFEPKRRGQHQAFLTVYHVLGQETILLRGMSVYPRLDVRAQDPSQLRVRIGTSRRVNFTVANTGDDSGRVESVSIVGPAYTNPTISTLPTTLMPGDSTTIAVDFSPTVFCENPVDISVRGEGVQGIYTLADTVARINGFGVAPLVSSRRPQINFGSRPVGPANDTTLDSFVGNLDFTGTIGGECLLDVVVDSIVIAGSGAASFQLLQPLTPLVAQPLPAADTLRPLAIRFIPATSGARRAELRIYFDGRADSVRIVELLGSGSVLPIDYGPTPGMSDIDFGRVLLTGERDSILTVTNTSSSPLSIDNIVAVGDFTVLSPLGGVVLAPGVPENVRVRFAPGSVGIKSAALVVQSGPLADSSFLLAGVGVTNALVAAPDSLEFGMRTVGSAADSAVLLINAPPSGINPQFVDSISISGVQIVQGTANFSGLGFPSVLAVGGNDSLRIRFNATAPSGRKTGIARVFFNRRQRNGVPASDSLDVRLGGEVGGTHRITFDLGPDRTGKPGDRIRVPVAIGGDVAGAALDSLDLLFTYRRTVLKPLSATSPQPGVTVAVDDHSGSGAAGRARLSVRSTGKFVVGELANVEFVVALGDSLETPLSLDSVITGRTDITAERDSIRFTINGFCDAQGRLVRFGSALRVVVTPNPATRSQSGLIALDLQESAPTSVVLYSLDGREVQRIFDGTAGPGTVTLPFDVSGLPAGTYNCILTARTHQASVVVQIIE